MGTLPGTAPTKADLDAADRPLWKRINLPLSHTCRNARSWARHGRSRNENERDRRTSKHWRTRLCLLKILVLFRLIVACVLGACVLAFCASARWPLLRRPPLTGYRRTWQRRRCRRTSGNPSLSLRNTTQDLRHGTATEIAILIVRTYPPCHLPNPFGFSDVLLHLVASLSL